MPDSESPTPLGASRRQVLAGGAVLAASLAGCADRTATPTPNAGAQFSTTAAGGRPNATTHAAAAPPRQPASAGPASEITAGSRTRPLVALTFHGAGDPALTVRALDVFARHRAHVTVLAVGTWLAAHPDLATRITRGGHELGNHTWSHRTMPDLTEAQALVETARCRDLLARLTGSPGRWFRPSGTQYATPLIRRVAGRCGYRVCLSYDVDPADYTDPGADAVRSRVAAAVRPGSIVSLHLGHPGTVDALPGILADLARRGLRAATASAVVSG